MRSIPSVCRSLAPPGSFFPSPRPSRVPVEAAASLPRRALPVAGEKARGRRAGDKSRRAPGHGQRARESAHQSGGDGPGLPGINGNKSKWGLPGAGGARGPPRSARERRRRGKALCKLLMKSPAGSIFVGFFFCGDFFFFFNRASDIGKVSLWGWGRGQEAAVQRELYWILSYFIF